MRRALASLSMAAIGFSTFVVPAFAGPRPSADLSIIKSGPSTVAFGASINYALTITNAGPSATGLTVSDNVPTGTKFLPEKSSPECVLKRKTVVCTARSNLAAGQRLVFIVSVVPTTTVCSPMTVKNVATVKGTVSDPNQRNNTSNTVTTSMTCTSPACYDGIDNDNDGAKDYPADFSCSSATDTDETNPKAACQDDVDNDRDGMVDANDVGCSGNQDNDEYNVPACSDGLDNDSDGNVDYPADKGCDSEGDLDESGEAYQCNDGQDNDGDNLVDYPQDPGCTGSLDDDEYNAPASGAELNITQKSTGSSDTVVRNQKNVNLMRFEVDAETEDVLITKIVALSAEGSAANAQNYTLWVDTDGNGGVDTKLQDGVASQNGLITFDQLYGGGWVAPDEDQYNRVLEIHADIASSISTPPALRLQFATSQLYVAAETASNGNPLQGIDTNNTCATGACQIHVTTVTSIQLQIANQGDLFVSKSVTPLRMRQLLGGTLESEILRLKLRAQNEDIDVTDLRFTSVDSSGTSIDRLELYLVGATTKFADATVGGCGSDPVPANTFCANMESRQLVIPEGSSTDILVRPRMKTDTDGGVAGQLIRLKVYPEDTVSSFDGAVSARGDQSSNSLSANDGDSVAEGEVFIGTDSPTSNAQILGQKNVVTMAEYTSMTNANPDADGTSVPTGISPFGQFKFTAASHANTLNGLNKTVLSGVILNVNATNVALAHNGFKLYNKADATQKLTCIAKDTNGVTLAAGNVTGSMLVYCNGLATSTVNTVLDQGTNAVYVLEGNITNPMISVSQSSALQASFQNFTTPSSDIPTVYGATTQHIQWIDRDTNSTTHAWIEYPDTVIKSTSYQN